MRLQRIGTGTPERSEAGRAPSANRVRAGRRVTVALLAVLGLFLSTLGFFPVTSEAHTVALPGANDVYSGTWPPNGTPGWNLPAANPSIAESCGIDVGILVDRSGSIADAGQQSTMRNSAKSIVDALAGTPSRVGVWSFGNGSSAAGDSTHPAQGLTEVGGAGGPAGVTSLKSTIDSIPIVSGVATNWEAGFGAVHDAAASAGDAADLLFVLTDGKPTVHIDDSSTGGTTNNDDLDGGIRTANLVKGDDTRVFAVGIGNLDATTLGLVSNNEAWSGANILTAGYAITDFADLQATLRDLVTALCGGTVTVLKRVEGAPANGWDFTLQGPGGPYNGTTGDDGLGLVGFDVDSLPWPDGSTVTLTETPQGGYALDGVTCTNSNGPDPVLTPVSNGVSFTLTPLSIIECIVDNEARPPAIDITKTANPAGPVSAGGVIGFDITVESTGESTANDVTVTDVLPAGMSWSENPDNPYCSIAAGTLSCAFGSLAPSVMRTVHVQATTDAQDCGTVVNSAYVATSNDGSDESTSSVEVLCPDVEIEKQADAASVSAGSPIGFTITATNTGPGTANNVVITDTLPSGPGISWSEDPNNPNCSIAAGTLTCSVTSLASGASLSVHVSSPTNAGSCGTYDNTAAVSLSNGAGDGDDASTTVECAEIDLVKEADAASVSAGSPIGFTITATNTGTGTANNVVITDALPSGPGISWSEDPNNPNCSIAAGTLTCSVTTLAAGASLSVHVSSPTTSTSCRTYDNTATVTTSNDGSDESSDSVSVLCPDVELVKEADAGSVAAGSPIGFTITATNYGPGTANNVVITDTLPSGPGISWSEDPNNPNCSIAAGTLTCSVTTLAAGASLSVHVSSPTTLDSCGTYDNTAASSVSNGASDQDSAEIDVLCADIEVVKTAVNSGDGCPGIDGVPLAVDEGDPVTYCYVVTNNGDGTAFGVALVDDNGTPGSPGDDFAVPLSGLTAGNLLPGQIATGSASGFEFEPGTVVNTATVTATTGGGLPLSDGDTAEVQVADVEPTIEVTKNGDPTVLLEPGGEVEFTVDVENTSDEPVWITSITDSVDGGSPFDVTALADTTCATGVEIAAGDTYTCTFTLEVNGNAGDVIDDTVVVTAVDDDDSEATDEDDESVEVTDVEPTIEVSKSGDPTIVQEPGGEVTFTVDVENTSDEPVWITSITDSVEGGVPFDVTALAGTTCATGVEIAAGDTYTCTFTLEVNGNAGNVIDDTVVVTAVDDDDSEATDEDDESVEVTDVEPTIEVTKDADPTSVSEPGAEVEYTVDVTNTSDESVWITSILDSVEGGSPVDVTALAGTSCATGVEIAAGDTYTCTFTLEVTGNAGDVVDDVVAATVVDDDESEATDDDDASVEITDVPPTVDVVKDNGDASVLAPGGDVLFTVEVTNTSQEDVTVVSITDSVDGGAAFDVTVVGGPVLSTTCETGVVLAPDETYECSFTVEVAGLGGEVISDTVVATVVDGDGSEATDDDDEDTPVVPVADLAIDKEFTSTVLTPGGQGAFDLVVTNLGPSDATDVVVTDVLPDGLVFVSASGPGWACSAEGQMVTCTRPSLAVDESSSISVVVSVAADVAAGEVVNVASVRGDEFDPDYDNNEDTDLAPVVRVLPAAAQLPVTGSDLGRQVGVALMVLSAGLALVALSRRRLIGVSR